MNIQVFGAEADAVRLGDIRGDVYADGEVYAQAHALEQWRFHNPHKAHGQLSLVGPGESGPDNDGEDDEAAA